MAKSPLGIYLEHCKKGELAYQVTDDGKPVFFPRAVAPVTGRQSRVARSKGLGTVYSTTVVYDKDEPPLNVALIDLDEGFRMMSRVEDIDPLQVKIGMRVKVRMHPGDEKQPPYPVFTPRRDREMSRKRGSVAVVGAAESDLGQVAPAHEPGRSHGAGDDARAGRLRAQALRHRRPFSRRTQSRMAPMALARVPAHQAALLRRHDRSAAPPSWRMSRTRRPRSSTGCAKSR